MFPLKPPRDWFDTPEADQPTPLTYEKSGRVYGHVALWGSCHTGFLNGALSECVQPPKSASGYRHFHLGVLETDRGDVPVGKITYQTGHAPLQASLKAATSHYDNTGAVGAFVHVRDGALGIWAAGAVKSDLSPEGFRDLRANGPSGDWRGSGRGLEMIAALAVPVQGFPVPRAQLALSASADVEVLILPAWLPPLEEELALVASADYQERKRALTAAIHEPVVRDRDFLRRRAALSAAALTSERRKDLPRSAFAIPETRSYPIHDRAHAANALARSAGKPEADRVKAAVCKRYADMPACK